MPSLVKQCALFSLSLDTSPEVEAMAQREAQLAKREEQVAEAEAEGTRKSAELAGKLAALELESAVQREQVYELESALAHKREDPEAGHVQRAKELQAATEAADAQFALALASRTAEDEERLRVTCAGAREQVMAELREEERARLEALNPVADKSYAALLRRLPDRAAKHCPGKRLRDRS